MSIINYKRVLLKLSGEALMGDSQFGHDFTTLHRIADDIKEVLDLGVELSLVVGGGNICRGSDASEHGMERSSADYMGMLATVINALALQSVLEGKGVFTRVLSAIPMMSVCEPYIRRKAKRHLEKGRVVIFAAGIGSPFFTTDSAAVLRAAEMNCDIVLKGTNVDGVYDKDPHKYESAHKFDDVTYEQVLQERLNVMDMAAIAIARENHLPITVFSIKTHGNIARVLKGDGNYTRIVSE